MGNSKSKEHPNSANSPNQQKQPSFAKKTFNMAKTSLLAERPNNVDSTLGGMFLPGELTKKAEEEQERAVISKLKKTVINDPPPNDTIVASQIEAATAEIANLDLPSFCANSKVARS